MARIRTVKPEFWTDEALTECSMSARLMFIGMFNFSDDVGNIERSSKQLKMKIFPADNIDCEPLVHELMTHGILIEYSVSDKKYLHIKGFRKHQVINRPSKSNIPEYNSVNDAGTLTEDSLREGKGREGKGILELPLKDGSRWKPEEEFIGEMIKAYPNISVEKEFSLMVAWLVANPAKQKTRIGIKKFVNSWLGRVKPDDKKQSSTEVQECVE